MLPAAVLLVATWRTGDTWSAVRELTYDNPAEEIAETHVESLRYVASGSSTLRIERKLVETRFGSERVPCPQNVEPDVSSATIGPSGGWSIPELPSERTYRFLAGLFEALPGHFDEASFTSARRDVLTLSATRTSFGPTLATFRVQFQAPSSERPVWGDGTFDLRPTDGQLVRADIVAHDVQLPGGTDRATLTIRYRLAKGAP